MADAPRRRYRFYRECSPALILVGGLILYHFAPQYRAAEEMGSWTRTDVRVERAEARREGSLWNSFWNRHEPAPGDGPGDAAREWRVFIAYAFKDAGGKERRGEGTYGEFRRAEAERVAREHERTRAATVWFDPADPDRSAPAIVPRDAVLFSCAAGLLLVLLGVVIFLAVSYAQKRGGDGTPDWAALPR